VPSYLEIECPLIKTIQNLTLVDLQLEAKNSYLCIYNTFIKILYMFRALPCSSSGGLRRNCIYAASGFVTLCRWLSFAPVKKECSKHLEDFNKCIIRKYIRILWFKLEINQGYTTMHGQPIIKTFNTYLCRLFPHVTILVFMMGCLELLTGQRYRPVYSLRFDYVRGISAPQSNNGV
jgi:hypothetical protein